ERAYPERILESDVKKILAAKPDLLITGAWYEFNLPYVLELAGRLKKESEIPIIVGGPVASSMGARIIHGFPQIDICVTGEIEHSLRQVIETIKKGTGFETVEGLVFRKDGETISTKPQKIPFPVSEANIPDFSAIMDIKNYSMIPIQTSRGCANNCGFCTSEKQFPGLRQKPVEKVIEEIMYQKAKYRKQVFQITDNNFTSNNRYVEEFCRLLKKEGVDIQWNCFSRTDTASKQLIDQMGAAGCREVFYGLESANHQTLRLTNKSRFPSDYLQHAKKIVAHTNQVTTSKVAAIIGFPWETKKDMLNTIGFMDSLQSAENHLSKLVILPGSAFWNNYQRKRIKLFKMNNLTWLRQQLFSENYTDTPWIVPGAYLPKNNHLDADELEHFIISKVMTVNEKEKYLKA
ncbi:B12-binding domain-containing radical SAM protein, partial [Thermoproteota archaeon]